MKVRIIKEFFDKYTGEKYEVGTVIDITKERLAEIETVSKLLVEKVPETKAKTKKEV